MDIIKFLKNCDYKLTKLPAPIVSKRHEIILESLSFIYFVRYSFKSIKLTRKRKNMLSKGESFCKG
jgi:hypothetical protein